MTPAKKMMATENKINAVLRLFGFFLSFFIVAFAVLDAALE